MIYHAVVYTDINKYTVEYIIIKIIIMKMLSSSYPTWFMHSLNTR